MRGGAKTWRLGPQSFEDSLLYGHDETTAPVSLPTTALPQLPKKKGPFFFLFP